MSFLIPENQDPQLPPTSGPVPTRWERFMAARDRTALEMDSWQRSQRVRAELVSEIQSRIGRDDAPLRLVPGAAGGDFAAVTDAMVDRTLGRAAGLQDLPDKTALEGVPLDRAAFDAEVQRRLRAEYAEAAEVMGMAPDGGWFPELAGALSAGFTDHTTIATLPFGAAPGMSIRAAMIAEGLAGVAAEAASLPAQQRMAETLGIEDPDVLLQLTLSGGLSAGLGGAVQAAPRAVRYLSEQRAASAEARAGARNATEQEAQVQAAARGLDADPRVRPEDPAADTTVRTGSGAGTVIEFAMGPRRPNPPDRPILDVLEQAAADVFGPGARVRITSGQEGSLPQHGSTRHKTGNAADFALFRPDGSQVRLTDPEARAFLLAAARRGAKGIGAGAEYMGDHFHVDLVDPDPRQGQGHVWGSMASALREDLVGAMRGAVPDIFTPARWSRITDAIIGVESSGRATARNPRSTAEGLGQILDATWLELIRRNRPDLAEGRTDQYLLQLKFDRRLNREMTQAYARENAARLQAEGLPVTPPNLYLAHFLGPTGAVRALQLRPDAPITAAMSARQIADNAGVRHNGKRLADFTVADLRAWASYKMRGAFDVADVQDGVRFEGYTSSGYTRSGQVVAGDTRIDVDYEVVDAASLRPASGDLQPRDRSRVSSDEQIADIARKLDPARLMPAPEADRGAPVVGPDNVIESGNGRVMAINRAAERYPDRFAAYLSQLRQSGYEIPEGVTRPILVARRTSELTPDARRQFVIDANTSTIARMSATERSRADAVGLDTDTLALLDTAQPLNGTANKAFVGRALSLMPQTERAGLTNAQGVLNAEGIRRLQQMVFARAYDAPDIVARYAETDAGELRSLIEALDIAAPKWAALRTAVADGEIRPEFDITVPMLDALRLIANARQLAAQEKLTLGRALEQLLADVDLLKGAVDPLTAALVGRFWTGRGVARADEVAGFLSRYADEARRVGQVEPGLLGDGPGLTQVLQRLDPDTFADMPAEYRPPVPEPPRAAEPVPVPADELAEGAVSDPVIVADRAVFDGLRADIAEARGIAADIELPLGPDGELVRASQLLDDIEADETLADILDICVAGGRRG